MKSYIKWLLQFFLFFFGKILKKLKKLELSPQNFLYDVLNLLYSGCKAFFQSKSVVHRRSPHFEISKFMISILCFFKHFHEFKTKIGRWKFFTPWDFQLFNSSCYKKTIFEPKMTICGDLAIVYRLCATVYMLRLVYVIG